MINNVFHKTLIPVQLITFALLALTSCGGGGSATFESTRVTINFSTATGSSEALLTETAGEADKRTEAVIPRDVGCIIAIVSAVDIASNIRKEFEITQDMYTGGSDASFSFYVPSGYDRHIKISAYAGLCSFPYEARYEYETWVDLLNTHYGLNAMLEFIGTGMPGMWDGPWWYPENDDTMNDDDDGDTSMDDDGDKPNPREPSCVETPGYC